VFSLLLTSNSLKRLLFFNAKKASKLSIFNATSGFYGQSITFSSIEAERADKKESLMQSVS
jgi:hypothetical protein